MEHIKYRICPECGCPFESFRQDVEKWTITHQCPTVRRHVNGENFERISFACGRVDEYTPNYSAISTVLPCNNSDARLTELTLANKKLKEIADFIAGVEGLSEEVQRSILRDIKWRII